MFARHTLLKITRLVGLLDQQLQTFLNGLLHQTEFQQLEARWRALAWLVQQLPARNMVKILLWDIRWEELSHDILQSVDLDHSICFHQIYDQAFGIAGGEPYGFIIGDFAINIKQPQPLAVLKGLADIAAAAFVPMAFSVDPAGLGLNHFTDIAKVEQWNYLNLQADYRYWQQLRHYENSRFINLVLPGFVMREPYTNDNTLSQGFAFTETGLGKLENWLWANPCFALAWAVLHSVHKTSWFTQMTGNPIASLNLSQAMDAVNAMPKLSTVVQLTEEQEHILSEQGFIALYTDAITKQPLFYRLQAIHHTQKQLNENQQLTLLLSYLLCACRFAHYLKVISRNKMGSFQTPTACAHYLNQWLRQYTAQNDISLAQRANYPLRRAHVELKQRAGLPGYYAAVIYLVPHFQVENVEAELVLLTEFSPLTLSRSS